MPSITVRCCGVFYDENRTERRRTTALSEAILKPSVNPTIKADAYFFDIDGTLMVSRDLVHWHAMHQAMLEVYGLDANFDGIPYHGKTDVAILRMAVTRRGISQATFADKLPAALGVVRREVSANVAGLKPDVCASVPKLLAEIRERDKLLGVASGNLESVGWHKLTAAKIRQFFTCGSFGDNFELRVAIFDHAVSSAKSRLGNSASVCFFGDTPDDIHAARKVNAQIVAVGTGIFPVAELAHFQPDFCCQSCTEMLGRLQ
jgi:phosphoglycolate phosphatase